MFPLRKKARRKATMLPRRPEPYASNWDHKASRVRFREIRGPRTAQDKVLKSFLGLIWPSRLYFGRIERCSFRPLGPWALRVPAPLPGSWARYANLREFQGVQGRPKRKARRTRERDPPKLFQGPLAPRAPMAFLLALPGLPGTPSN